MFFSFSSRLLSYTGHSLITAVYFYIVEVFTSSKYIRSYDILLENATEILLLNPINFFLQSASVFLLQNATVLLQNAIDLQNTIVIIKCDNYYKTRLCTLVNQYLIH